MKKEVFKRSAFFTLRAGITSVLFTLVVMAMIIFGLYQAGQSSRAEGLRVLEESILRAAVKCYAVEGSYPDNISYIEENYGVYIDRTKYAVHYDIFASNILPDITVIDLNK